MKKINDLIDSFELEELNEREEFVAAPDRIENQEQDGITLLRWTVDI